MPCLLGRRELAASLLHRGRVPLISVPTTPTAVADVAVGSKTAANVDTPFPLKNALGTYHNPAAVLLDAGYVESMPASALCLGTAESLKHGLLQDCDLFESCLQELRATAPDARPVFAIAERTLELKRVVLSFDPWEEDLGRVLLYGHIAAHSLERSLGFRVAHAVAVLWGVLVDLNLDGSMENDTASATYRRLLPVLEPHIKFTRPSGRVLKKSFAVDTRLDASGRAWLIGVAP